MSELQELFTQSLKDVYHAEKTVMKAMNKVAKKVRSEELRSALKDHVKETGTQVERLDAVFQELGKKAQAKKCPAILGLVEEAEEIIEENDGSDALDVGLIGSLQAVEHYEIARYGTLIAWAEAMEMNKAAKLLNQTLEEERAFDERLNEIATDLNEQIASSQGDEHDGDSD